MATAEIIGSVSYNRVLIGMFIGLLLGRCKPHPFIRGAMAGIIVSLALGITPLLDEESMGALILVGEGSVCGLIIDGDTFWLAKGKAV